MNQDEQYQQQYDDVWNAVIKNMLISDSDSCFDNIPSEEEIRQSHDFSPEFLRNMDVLLHKNQTPKRKLRHPAKSAGEQGIEEPDQSFWEEWKHQHQTAGGSFTDGSSHKLRRPVKAAVAAAAVLAVTVSGIHLSGSGFLRASRTQNVVEYGGESMLLTDMADKDYDIIFKKPGFIPKEYKLISYYTTHYMRILEYSDGTKTLSIKYNLLSIDADISLDNERHFQKGKNIRLNQKYDAILFTPEQLDAYTALTWQDGLIQYQIYSHESEKILIQIAESIAP